MILWNYQNNATIMNQIM